MTVYLFKGTWTRQLVRSYPERTFVFGDNLADAASGYVPSMTQAVIRGLPNAIGIPTKRDRNWDTSSFFTDADYDEFCGYVDEAIRKVREAGDVVVIPHAGIGTGKAQLPQRAPKCYAYLVKQLEGLRK